MTMKTKIFRGDKKRHKRLGYAFEKILEYYGLHEYHVNGTQIRMRCPIHHGDNKSAFVWRSEFQCWNCYSHSCQELYGSSAYGFILAMEDGDRRRAHEIAKEITDGNVDLIIERRQTRKKRVKQITHANQPAAWDIANSRFSYSTYPYERGIPRDIQERYKIGIYKDLYPDKVGFPVFDTKSRIVGITLRTLHQSKTAPKWIHKPDGYKSSVNLYNIHRATPYNGTMIVTEGPIDVLKLVTGGISNCVASFGCRLTNEQIELLRQVGTYKVVLAYDDDEAGQKGMRQAARTLELQGIEAWRLVFNEGYNDFGEMPICLIKRKDWRVVKF